LLWHIGNHRTITGVAIKRLHGQCSRLQLIHGQLALEASERRVEDLGLQQRVACDDEFGDRHGHNLCLARCAHAKHQPADKPC